MITITPKISLTALLSIFLLQSFAQQNFQPGSIQKLNGETVQGWIDYRAWGQNPKSIHFRESENGASATYTIDDLSAFSITGRESYVRAEVSKDMRPVLLNSITSNTPDSTVSDIAFLRIITEGPKLSLYELVDEKPHYYTRVATGPYQELLYKLYITESGQLDERPIYRDQLRAYFIAEGNPDKLKRELKKTRYLDDDLALIVHAINGDNPPPAKAGRGTTTKFFASAGLSYSTLTTDGYEKLKGISYDASISPVLGLGVDILSKRQLNAFALRLEILYSSGNFKGSRKYTSYSDELERTYSLKVSNFSPSLSFIYSPIRKETYRVYVGLGIAYNFTSYPKNIWEEVNTTQNTTKTMDDFLDYEKGWISGLGHLGVTIKDFDFILGSKIYGAFERYEFINISFHTYSLRAAYRF